ncbi:MAG TPA: hypothetical protein VGR47_08315 [Terracidiphilus sp.]|nr:hypothetical protein [Terracidiphilus sp.]HEV2398056.1 hypothetical protein [Candidatus Sulfotelmatobacter sp.]
MWIFSIYGFYSIACATNTDGTLDPAVVMVRARCKDHLQNLQKRCPELASSKILSPPNRDYGYRLIIPKAIWVAALQEMAEEQTWGNFKNEVAQRMGGDGADYTDALHDVWRTMYRLQESETRQGWS